MGQKRLRISGEDDKFIVFKSAQRLLLMIIMIYLFINKLEHDVQNINTKLYMYAHNK